jgi:hypothetical protein
MTQKPLRLMTSPASSNRSPSREIPLRRKLEVLAQLFRQGRSASFDRPAPRKQESLRAARGPWCRSGWSTYR